MTIVAPNSKTIFPVFFFLRRLPFLPTQVGSQACDPHPKVLTWGVVSKGTLHACIVNVVLLTTRQVKNLGCGSSLSSFLKRNDSVQLPGRRLPFLPTQIGRQTCDPHPKFLTWGVVSKTTLIMHACIINVLVLTVNAKDIDYARVRN